MWHIIWPSFCVLGLVIRCGDSHALENKTPARIDDSRYSINYEYAGGVIDLNDMGLEALVDFEEYKSRSVRVVRLSENRLRSFESHSFIHLPDLTHLYLNENEIEQIRVNSSLASLVFLDLSSNKLTSIPQSAFLSLTSLRILLLNGNSIKSLEFLSLLSSLQVLELKSNKIAAIDESTFTQSQAGLLVLNLESNEIESIAPESFQSLSSLETLSLNDNPFRKDSLDASVAFYCLKQLRHLTFCKSRDIFWFQRSYCSFNSREKVEGLLNQAANLRIECKAPSRLTTPSTTTESSTTTTTTLPMCIPATTTESSTTTTLPDTFCAELSPTFQLALYPCHRK